MEASNPNPRKARKKICALFDELFGNVLAFDRP